MMCTVRGSQHSFVVFDVSLLSPPHHLYVYLMLQFQSVVVGLNEASEAKHRSP